MNSFATIEEFKRLKIVGYYSLKSEDKDLSEAEDFFSRMENDREAADQIERLVYWLYKVGEECGAYDDYFRHEGASEAFPPYVEITGEKIDLRLYCYRVNHRVVILFNGGLKTARTAQECPNVRRHHSNAERWARQLKKERIVTKRNEIVNREEILINY